MNIGNWQNEITYKIKMENLIFQTVGGEINFHETPWNDAVLMGKSVEIDSIYAVSEQIKDLLNAFCSYLRSKNYLLIALRSDDFSKSFRKSLFEAGFIAVEHTLNASTNNLNLELLKKFKVHSSFVISDFSNEDIVGIQTLAGCEFEFGRFFEDPFISYEKANKRNENWINDIIKQKATIKTIKNGKDVIGFLAFSENDNYINLLLGGINKNYRMLTYGFWAKVLVEIGNNKKISATISSCNINAINLYTNLGFKFELPKVGYHKFLTT